MSKSNSRKQFDIWLTENYSKLVTYAKKLHKENSDLVHHTYDRIIKLEGVDIEKVLRKPMNYFKRAMYFEATRGEFKKQYEILDTHIVDVPSDYDLSEAIMAENFQLAVDRLSWFDGTVLMLYCNGYNLTQVSRESGIKTSVLHTSLHRSRKKLKIHFNK